MADNHSDQQQQQQSISDVLYNRTPDNTPDVWRAFKDSIQAPLQDKNFWEVLRVLGIRFLVSILLTYAMLATVLTFVVALVMGVVVYYSVSSLSSSL